ncbi:hypothetical protein D3C85_1276550 [compost metagenome]
MSLSPVKVAILAVANKVQCVLTIIDRLARFDCKLLVVLILIHNIFGNRQLYTTKGIDYIAESLEVNGCIILSLMSEESFYCIFGHLLPAKCAGVIDLILLVLANNLRIGISRDRD